jgi:hypothetical protein
MTTPTLEKIQKDDLAMSVARAVAIANEEAVSRGMDLSQALVTVTEESPPPDPVWQVHYGPRDYTNRRGGDLIVVVNERAGAVARVIHGQ